MKLSKLDKLLDRLGDWWCHRYHKQWHGWPNSGNQCCMKCARSWRHEWPGEEIGS